MPSSRRRAPNPQRELAPLLGQWPVGPAADAAVIGVPSDRWGETPKAMIVRAAGADPTEQEIIDYCRERLAKFKCPTSVDWVDALPRNPSGKILKKDLRAPYWAGRDRFVS